MSALNFLLRLLPRIQLLDIQWFKNSPDYDPDAALYKYLSSLQVYFTSIFTRLFRPSCHYDYYTSTFQVSKWRLIWVLCPKCVQSVSGTPGIPPQVSSFPKVYILNICVWRKKEVLGEEEVEDKGGPFHTWQKPSWLVFTTATLLCLWSVCVCVCSVAQLCLTHCGPMDCSPPVSSVHGISQARILEWVAIFLYRESSQPRDQTYVSCISCINRWILYH